METALKRANFLIIPAIASAGTMLFAPAIEAGLSMIGRFWSEFCHYLHYLGLIICSG